MTPVKLESGGLGLESSTLHVVPLSHCTCNEERFIFVNSADPDEMPHNAAFHLGRHCLPLYLCACIRSKYGAILIFNRKSDRWLKSFSAVFFCFLRRTGLPSYLRLQLKI